MTTFLFFYNITLMIVYTFCFVIFLFLFQKDKKMIYKYIGVMFLFFLCSNLIYFMKEFLPTFSDLYENTFPINVRFVSIVDTMGLLYNRSILKMLCGKPIKKIDQYLWLIFVVLNFITPFAMLAALALLSVSFIQAGLTIYRNKDSNNRIVKICGSFLFFALNFINLVEGIEIVYHYGSIMIAESFAYDMIDRGLFAELIGIFYACLALWYAVTHMLKNPDSEKDIKAQKVRFDEMCGAYGLTNREKEIAALLTEGYSNAEISEALCISIGTTKTHIHHIYNKFGVNTRIRLLAKLSDTDS